MSQGAYWVMTQSVLGRTKGSCENKLAEKTKIKCYHKPPFSKNIHLKSIKLGLWNVKWGFQLFLLCVLWLGDKCSIRFHSVGSWLPSSAFKAWHSELTLELWKLGAWETAFHTGFPWPFGHLLLSLPSRLWLILGYRPSNPVPLNHIWIMDALWDSERSNGPLLSTQTHTYTPSLWFSPSMEGKKVLLFLAYVSNISRELRKTGLEIASVLKTFVFPWKTQTVTLNFSSHLCQADNTTIVS